MAIVSLKLSVILILLCSATLSDLLRPPRHAKGKIICGKAVKRTGVMLKGFKEGLKRNQLSGLLEAYEDCIRALEGIRYKRIMTDKGFRGEKAAHKWLPNFSPLRGHENFILGN